MILPTQPDSLGITTQQFIDELRGPDAEIYLNVGGKTWKNKPKVFRKVSPTLKWLNEDKNKDIYYIPNHGGTTNESIDLITAVFADWDCGKDGNGNYFDIETVAQKKLEYIPKIEGSPLAPSYVIETRNGYQLYWFVYPGMTNEQFTDIQKRIAYFFKGDPVVHNPARVMRLPGFYWTKPTKGCPRFFVRIVSHCDRRYYYNEINSSFPSVSDTEYELYAAQCRGKPKKNTDKGKTGSGKNESGEESGERISAHNNSGDIKDNTFAIIVGTKNPSPVVPITSEDGTSVVEYLKKQDLAEYLNIKNSGRVTPSGGITFHCIFHHDTSPSASIFVSRSGCYMYKCHSPECSFKCGTIIDVVREREKGTTSEAIGILIKHFGLKEDTSWIEDQREMLGRNIEVICNLDNHKDRYPNLYHMIGRVRNDLLTKLEHARKTVALRTTNNENLVICSLRYFHELGSRWCNGRELGRQNERIDRYVLLGLMRKLPDESINKSVLERANEVRDSLKKQMDANQRYKESTSGTKGDRESDVYRIQVYSIPEYTDLLLTKAEEIAKKCRESGIKMNSISRDMILLVFGEKKSREVYPQVDSCELSPSGKDLMKEIEKELLHDIGKKGYTKESELVKQLHRFDKWESLTSRRVRKYIPALMIKHDLVQVSANKQLKTDLNIDSRGYPRILIKKSTPTVSESPDPQAKTPCPNV